MKKMKNERVKTKATASARTRATTSAKTSVEEALAWLERRGSKKQLEQHKKFGIVAHRPFGVSVGDIKQYSKTIGKDHALAQELWESERYEARILAIFIERPEDVTVRQMNQWARDFDNWGLVDTACFHLFDRTPHAWKKVAQWSTAKPEFTKRSAFALLWSLTVHDKLAADALYLDGLGRIEKAATDERHFVKLAVNMALRAVGKRNASLHAAALETAAGLAKSKDATARWIGSHALRELESAAVRSKVKAKRS